MKTERKPATPTRAAGRFDITKRFELVRMLVAVLIGMGVTAVVVFAVSKTPAQSLRLLFLGPFERTRYLFNVAELMVPLMFTGVAISIVFAAQQFSLGAEGIFFFGGMVAAVAAMRLPLPALLHPLACIALAGLAGMLLGAVPGLLKHLWNTSELVTSLMLNYICFSMSMYVIKNFYRDKDAGAIVSYPFRDTAVLGKLVQGYRLTTIGVLLVAAVCAATYLLLYQTRWGFSLRAAGLNMSFAKYSGLHVAFAVVGSQMLAGLVAGMGGAIEMLSMYNRFQWTQLTGYGWDGIIVAIFAKNNPKNIPFAAAFLAYLRIGADIMMRRTGVQMEIVKVIQAIIIVLLVAESFLHRFRHRMVVREATRDPLAGTEVA